MFEKNEFLKKIVGMLDAPENTVLVQEVEECRKASDENERFYQEILQIWNDSSDLRIIEQISVEDSIERLNSKIGVHPPAVKRPNVFWFKSIAAAAVLAIMAVWLYKSFQPQQFITKTTSSGQIDSLSLPDGSKIYLSENSSFSYPETFKGHKRVVRLNTGQAFFKITEDISHPFVVELNSSSVTVLGTSFNIKSNSNNLEISVSTGTVRFSPADENKAVVINKGSGIFYNLSDKIYRSFNVTNQNADAWLTKELKFTDSPLKDVLSALETYYKIRVISTGSISSYNKFNANFKNSSLNEVLEILKETYPLKVSLKDSVVFITSK